MLDRLFKRKPAFEPYIAKDRDFDGMKFDFWINDLVGKEWYDGNSDQTMPERLWCRDHIKPGMHVVDCGAHHGMMSVLFSRWCGDSGRVTTYEVLPTNRAIIAKNAQLNNCSNIIVRPFGVSETNGQGVISQNWGNANNQNGTDTIKVDLVSLDTDLHTQRIDFLKIDVEGYELAALRGAQQIIRESRPTICLELHCFLYGEKRNAVIRNIFTALGDDYTFEILSEICSPVERLARENMMVLALSPNPHLLCRPK